MIICAMISGTLRNPGDAGKPPSILTEPRILEHKLSEVDVGVATTYQWNRDATHACQRLAFVAGMRKTMSAVSLEAVLDALCSCG